MPRIVTVIALVGCVSALSLPASAQRRAFLKDHRAIRVLPTTIGPTASRDDLYLSKVAPSTHTIAAELPLALRELKFEIADKAPITGYVVIHKHTACKQFGDFCFGGTTEADLVFTDSTSGETQTIRMQVGGDLRFDRMPPTTTAPEDWEYFASIQSRINGTRYWNFQQRLVQEIRRLM